MAHKPGEFLRPRKVVIVGAGPVGCLSALSFAKQGWEVEVFEGRPDMREPEAKANLSLRSINLAISSRGISALCVVDPAIADRFMQNVIPMHGRMIHDNLGQCQSQLYDRDGQSINSIDRGLLNIGLLDELSNYSNIHLHFRTKLTTVDFNSRVATFSSGERTFDVDFDLCVGKMDYQQEYLPHDYIELSIPPGCGVNGEPTFLLDPNHLHIWPRHSFMLIALPNKDRSFTCTLFAPTKDLDQLDTTDKFVAWFEIHFRDALGHIGRDRLVASFERNPRNSLICVKANPYHYKDRAIIIGDAAHAMTPFYGQGLNCGLEDVRVLMNTLLSFGVSSTVSATEAPSEDKQLSQALAYYSEHRHQDLVAICDLAMGNYHFNHLYAFPRMAVIEGHEHKAFIPYTNIFKILNLEARRLDEPRSSGHQLIHGHITRLEPHRVYYSPISDSSATEQSVDFDYMVYALGSHLPSPINVWADPVPVHEQPESDLPKSNRHGNKPEGTSWLCAAQARLKEAHSVLVIGGGALGVQFASDAAALYPRKNITLVHSGAQLLPRFNVWMHDAAMEGLRELGVSVLLSSRVDLNSAEDHDGKRTLKTVDGRRIGAELVVRTPNAIIITQRDLIPFQLMCTGQRPNTSLLSNVSPSSIEPRTGLVNVLRSLQLGPGSSSTSTDSPMPHIFVIGDAADAFGALNAGHTAWTQAEVACRNIGRLITGSGEELERYEAPPHSIKVTLGLDRAIFQSKGQFGKKQGEECALDLNTPSMWTRRGLSTENMRI
ncbi:kynurenine 3-monooxygenase, mitochondrial precursor [Ceratobasidium sp. 423]|nr:kynurenine 3-monooxygenase, mitochondrial precursor [Ceratobasidium sp. 423]